MPRLVSDDDATSDTTDQTKWQTEPKGSPLAFLKLAGVSYGQDYGFTVYNWCLKLAVRQLQTAVLMYCCGGFPRFGRLN